MTTAIPIIRSIQSVNAGRRGWLVDIWGVMHNGVSPFAEAVAACQAFKSAGGVVVLLSNSPRTRDGVIAQLRDIGVPDDAYDGAVTSGDATRVLIGAVSDQPVFHLGPERDLPIFDGLGVDRVAEAEAKAVVCTGLFDDTSETAEDYAEMLARLKDRSVPMICANPDITVERGGRIIFCAGALAEAYSALGGEVRLAGKPHAPIYELALDTLAEVAGERLGGPDVLAIGDGVKTDIAGAAGAGLASVYVASAVGLGLGGALNEQAVADLFAGLPARPVAAMPGLAW